MKKLTNTANNQRLTKRVSFRLTEKDYRHFLEVVKTHRVKQAEFLRQLTLSGLDALENSLKLKLIKELIKEIHRIGINLNQLARWANTYKNTAEAHKVLTKLDEIKKDLQTLLKQTQKL